MNKTLDMTKVFDNLEKLQMVLVEKYETEAKIEDVPKQLTSQEELLARLKKEYIEKNSKYEELKDKVSKLKTDLEEVVASREAGEKGMDNISTHREYEALDKQITEATARETELRKELQKEEKNLAELDEIIKTDESVIKSQEKDLNEAGASLDKETSKLKKELAALQKKEDNLVPNIDPEIKYKFERIIQRNNEGVVYVKNGVCGGCHMILPAQFANEVRDEKQILFCPYCSRILRWQEAKGDEQDFYIMNDAGSLLDEDDSLNSDENDDENGDESTSYDDSDSREDGFDEINEDDGDDIDDSEEESED